MGDHRHRRSPIKARQVTENRAWRGCCGDRDVLKILKRVSPILRCMSGDLITHVVLRIEPESGRGLKASTESN